MIAAERRFESREGLAAGLAHDVAAALRRSVAQKGSALLAVSGGITPQLFFETLSHVEIPWEKVTVTLVDERQVPETNERSNARLVRTFLLRHLAAAARFVPLYNSPEAALLGPLDAAVLGMGIDGHTASFLSGGDRLAEALDPSEQRRIIEINAPGAGESRLTLTLPVILASAFIALHIEGEEKRVILNQALSEGPIEAMPIRAILQAQAPIIVYWCA